MQLRRLGNQTRPFLRYWAALARLRRLGAGAAGAARCLDGEAGAAAASGEANAAFALVLGRWRCCGVRKSYCAALGDGLGLPALGDGSGTALPPAMPSGLTALAAGRGLRGCGRGRRQARLWLSGGPAGAGLGRPPPPRRRPRGIYAQVRG